MTEPGIGFVIVFTTGLCFVPSTLRSEESPYLQVVRTFADNVFAHGRDFYGDQHTPLFVDGIDIDTHEPVVWKLSAEHAESWKMPRQWIPSNLASQQHFFRVLDTLTLLTDDPKYRRAAVDATRYAFDHLRHEDGLLYWGGHAAWDLDTDQPVGEGRSERGAGKHELKCNLPYYELMWDVDREITKRFIEAFWSNHILRWDILDMNRHGVYRPVPDDVWDHAYVGGPVPFVGDGLTFLNTACDLFYSAALLSEFTEDDRPLLWARRLALRFDEVRHPVTGLGADNYSVLPSHRIQAQFEPEFGDRITEATFSSLYGLRYGRAAVCQLKLAERLGPDGDEFKQSAIRDLKAFARYAYDPADHTFWPTVNDGQKLTPADRKREGYVSFRWLEKQPAEGIEFWAYVLGWKHARDESLWNVARSIGAGLKLGDIGQASADPARCDLATECQDVHALFALLDLHEATHQTEYLTLARRIADNLIRNQFHKGFFVTSPDHVMCSFDTITPLALLHLEATLREDRNRLVPYAASKSYFHCSYDGEGRTYDIHLIYTRTRSDRDE